MHNMARVSADDSNEGPSRSQICHLEDDELPQKINSERQADLNQNLSSYLDAEQITPSNSNLDLSDRLRQSESEKIAVIVDHNNIIRNCNEKMETYLHEIRILNELNKGLKNDLNEMRDLSCYLDDDRRNCRRIAKEWQRFGRYTVTVMRDEVLSYSEKLSLLEAKQSDLMKENCELRDLCLYLDNKRKTGDSSDSEETEKVFKFIICSECKNLKRDGDKGLSLLSTAELSVNSAVRAEGSNSNTHVSKLEARIKQLEEERDFFITTFASKKDRKEKKRVSFSVPEDEFDSSSMSEQDRTETPTSLSSFDFNFRSSAYRDGQHGILRNGFLSPPPRMDNSNNVDLSSDSSNKINRAMQVLEIQEKLDRGSTSSTGSEEPMTEQEVAILKQMCNAAWSKLGDDHNVPLPSALLSFDSSTANEESRCSEETQSETQVLQALC